MNNINRHAVGACVAVALVSAIAGTFFDESRATRDAYAMAQASRTSTNAPTNGTRNPTGSRGDRTPAVAVVHVQPCAQDHVGSPRAAATDQGMDAVRCERPTIAIAATKEVNAHKNS